jgi:hypothetical protein
VDSDQLTARVAVLEAAIREHRSQRADDRCHLDDDRLYAALGDGIKCDRRVGDKLAMLRNCERFIDRRCEGGHWPTYADLEAERDHLRRAIRDAGFAVMETSGKWSIHDVSEKAKADDAVTMRVATGNVYLQIERDKLAADLARFTAAVPQTYGEAVARWGGAVVDCPGHEWDNRTTAENAAWLLDRLDADRAQLRAALEEIGLGDFRLGWLADAEAIWALRESAHPPADVVILWATRVRELVRCMQKAHAVAAGEARP